MRLVAMMAPAGLALAALAASPAWATPYTFTQLPISAGGLNNAGQVVGLSSIPNTNGYGSNLALYDHGAVKLLGFGPVGAFNNFVSVSGINDSGLIIGSTSTTHFSTPFAYLDGLPFDLGPARMTDSLLSGVNNKGDIVGIFGLSAGPGSAFLLSNGVLTALPPLPGVPPYPGGNIFLPTTPTGINDLGQIVGTDYTTGYYSTTGFLLSGGVYSPIAVPGSAQTFPAAINDNGEVVGTFNDAAGTQHGFEEENNIFSTIVGPGGADFLPSGLNNSGQIIGVVQDPSTGARTSYLGTPQAVPEPSTLALLCAGLTGLFGWRRVRQDSTQRLPPRAFRPGSPLKFSPPRPWLSKPWACKP